MNLLRSKMTEGQRLDMLIASSIEELLKNVPADGVSVNAMQQAVRAQQKNMLQMMTKPDGGLEGALGGMMSAMMLPQEAYNFATTGR
jgi:hypothetical protein